MFSVKKGTFWQVQILVQQQSSISSYAACCIIGVSTVNLLYSSGAPAFRAYLRVVCTSDSDNLALLPLCKWKCSGLHFNRD